VIAEEREDGILLRPAVAMPVEIAPERKPNFSSQRRGGREEYEVKEVRQMGVDGKNSLPAWE